MKPRSIDKLGSSRKLDLDFQARVFLLILICLFGGILSRLFWMQVLQGARYRDLSIQNRIRLVSSPPIRGRLLDREGRILADNKLTYSLSVQPRLIDGEEWQDLRINLSELLGIPISILDRRFIDGPRHDPYRITLYRNLKPEQVLRFKEKQSSLKGAQVDLELVRYYPYGSVAAHVLGYTQSINAKEFNFLEKKGYEIRDRIGRTGVEAAYESHLRGKWGGEMLEVDALGIVQQSIGYKPPQSGKDLILTLDLDLQLAAEDALKNKSAGAIIVLDPNSGAIRAMASRPTYDPNFFSKFYTTQKEYDKLFNSTRMPLFSRAVNAYDPGSTWKPVVAMAGMESNKFPPNTRLNTVACIKYGGHCFPEHNGRGYGWIGYEEALRVSSNTFFYQIGVGVGAKKLYEAATELGFDSLTGIEISYEESKGLVGNEEWAEKGRGWGRPGETPWIPEDIASASIGQAVIQITPLQLARAYAVFANGGYLVTPHLREENTFMNNSQLRKKVDIQDSTLNTIRSGLKKVVESGTGATINLDITNLPPLAGKTGTAEDSTGGSDHAWFVCFAPYDNSDVVIVAFAQNTPGGGSVHALPMARKVLKVWNEKRLSKKL